jgi:hypothetical protein
MTAVMIELQPRPSDVDNKELADDTPEGAETLEIISDLDKLTEYVMCSCSASDDNPY